MTQTNELELLRAKIITETATIEWNSLLGLFAKGVVIWVKPEIDLIEVALACTVDDPQKINQWMADNTIAPMPDDIAKTWLEQNQTVWASVVKPWVLVQAKN